MHVGELWRYPVKSMAGEMLREAALGDMGIAGDRLTYVVDDRGAVLTARNYPRLLLHKGGIANDGGPTVDGRRWDDESIAELVREATEPSGRLVRARGAERFDILPLLVATDGAIAAQGSGVDRRRFRPNILIAGVEGLAERTWEGKALRIGKVVIGLASLRGRCVMTTWDADTIEQDKRVLLNIIARYDGTLALNAWVGRGGTIRVGEEVELVEGLELGDPPAAGRYMKAN